MNPEVEKELQGHIEAISKILYDNRPQEELATFAEIEQTVRHLMQEHVTPQVAFFYPINN